MPKSHGHWCAKLRESTLINNLCKGAKTETGNRPGVTRGKQVVTLKSGIQLYDTPGTLWPKFESDETGLNWL